MQLGNCRFTGTKRCEPSDLISSLTLHNFGSFLTLVLTSCHVGLCIGLYMGLCIPTPKGEILKTIKSGLIGPMRLSGAWAQPSQWLAPGPRPNVSMTTGTFVQVYMICVFIYIYIYIYTYTYIIYLNCYFICFHNTSSLEPNRSRVKVLCKCIIHERVFTEVHDFLQSNSRRFMTLSQRFMTLWKVTHAGSWLSHIRSWLLWNHSRRFMTLPQRFMTFCKVTHRRSRLVHNGSWLDLLKSNSQRFMTFLQRFMTYLKSNSRMLMTLTQRFMTFWKVALGGSWLFHRGSWLFEKYVRWRNAVSISLGPARLIWTSHGSQTLGTCYV